MTRGIPSVDEIEIVRAEDPPPPRLTRRLPDATPVSELALSARCWNAIQYFAMKTVGDIRQESNAEFLRLPNFGRRSLYELREACGDDIKSGVGPKGLSHEQREIVTAMRMVAGHLYRLAELVEQAARNGTL